MRLEKNGYEYEVASAPFEGRGGEVTMHRAKAQCGRWTDWCYTITAALDATTLLDQQEREQAAQRFNDEQLRRARGGILVHPDSTSQLT